MNSLGENLTCATALSSILDKYGRILQILLVKYHTACYLLGDFYPKFC